MRDKKTKEKERNCCFLGCHSFALCFLFHFVSEYHSGLSKVHFSKVPVTSFSPSSITLFIAHFYYENHLPKFLSPRIRISHPSSHPSSIILFNHSCTYHPSFTLSSYISPHFIYQPLATLSCHKHAVVTNFSFLLSIYLHSSHFFSFSLRFH